MSELISHLWAGAGYRFIGYKGKDSKAFKMEKFESTAKALAFAKQCSELGCDVWFSCGLFGDGSRTQANFNGAVAFWLDLDVDSSNPQRFHSQAEALAELKEFCKAVGLPLPSIVSSGYGIHAYWLLDEMIDPDKWNRAATRLKAVTAARGLRSGPERTADSASVMRLPGTFNMKGAEPAPVVELKMQPPMSYQEFMDCLMRVPVSAETLTPKRNGAITTPDEFDIPMDYPPASAAKCSDECAQLRSVRDVKGDVEEPLWYASIGVWRHTEEGSEVIHDWSSGHAEYDPGETDMKIAQLEKRGIGPSTCAQFYGLNPQGCEGCKYKNNITSPIQLGVTVTEAMPEQEPETGQWLTEIKGKYFIGDQGVFMKQDNEAPEKILGVPMYLEKIGRLGFDDAIATVHWRTQRGTWQQTELSLMIIGEKAEMRKWLHKHSITSYWKVDRVMHWLKDFADELNAKADPEMICQRFGWVGSSSFMIGNDQVKAATIEPVRVSQRIPDQMVKGLQVKGDLQTWVKATAILAKEENWGQAFALLTSLAAPLFKLCGVQGAVASFAGPSGTGKTKGCEFACSAYGDPSSFVHAASSTLNAKGELLRTSNNLPVIIDEVGPISRQLSDLIYMGANGHAKERLRQTGELYGQESWQTVLMLTTNSPIMDLPESSVGEAERRRVLELYLEETISVPDVQLLHDTMTHHHGLMVRPFIQKLILNKDAIATRFRALSNQYLADESIPEANRFGVWLITASLIAGSIARSAGLILFNPEKPVNNALESIRENIGSTRRPEEVVDEAIRGFINGNLGAFSIKGVGKEWIRRPDREVFGRIDIHQEQISIPVHRVKKLLAENNIPGVAMKQWAEINVIDAKPVSLTRYASPERCYIIKNNNLINLDDTELSDDT